MKKVLIIYKFLPQYRVDFYQLLKKELFSYSIDLQLIYGQSNKTDALKGDETIPEWAQFIPNKRYYWGKTELLWQPCLKYLKGADLIIVQTENRLLLNYYLMMARRLSKFKVAFWGHVYNMQDDVHSRRNRIKLKTLHYTDWWFAYTKGVKQFLADQGYPANKITIVQNAIDTIGLKKYYADVTEEEVGELKKELGIVGSNVGIYCGGMYPDKHLDFILESCHLIKSTVPDFHMLFIGSGVEADKIKAAANQHDWIHYLGSKFGMDRVVYFKIASVQIMPGLVGLTILDSMAMETPMMTAEHPYHGPEVEYLENGKTGLITRFELHEYSTAIIDLLKNQKYIGMAEAGKQAVAEYTVQHMVSNFAQGIRACLAGN